MSIFDCDANKPFVEIFLKICRAPLWLSIFLTDCLVIQMQYTKLGLGICTKSNLSTLDLN